MTEFQETLVLGGIFAVIASGAAAIFQYWNWTHQENVKKLDRELASAQTAFDEISKNLDERLYRYRQLIFSFRRQDSEITEQKLEDYRKVLYRWNDNINRNYSTPREGYFFSRHHPPEIFTN